jgi:hypothetical protein
MTIGQRRKRMFKYKVITFILLIALFTTAKAYCQQGVDDQQIKTIVGTVTYVDVSGNIISVQTNHGLMVFNISVESDLLRFAHHMASIEIEKGDPVMIRYETTPFGKNEIIKLVDQRSGSL